MIILNRFELKVAKSPTCWIWKGSKYRSGYGEFRSLKGETRAHRVSWILFNGEIPKGLHVLHKCDVRDCVNPKHLFLGTHKENMIDRMKKGRTARMLGVAHGMSKLRDKDVLMIRELRLKKSLSYKAIAELFKLTPENVGYIVRRITWKHI